MWEFFNIVLFLLFFATLSLFFKLFLLVCFNFYFFKEDNMFYIHFQRGSPQQWIRAKGSSKSFLTKAPTPPWHHWEQSTHFFPFFWLFYLFYTCIYVFIIYLSCFFTILCRFTIFLGFFYIFFSLLDLFLVEIVYQINSNKRAWKKNAFTHFCWQPRRNKVTAEIGNRVLLSYSFLNKIIFLLLTMNQKNQKWYFKSKNISSSNSSERLQ